ARTPCCSAGARHDPRAAAPIHGDDHARREDAMTARPDWSGRTLAIIGGDRREQEIARQAAATGAAGRAFGFPCPDGGIPGVGRSASARDGARGALVALLPLPGMTGDQVFAPGGGAPVIVDLAVLSGMAPGGLVVAGTATPAFRKLLDGLGLR